MRTMAPLSLTGNDEFMTLKRGAWAETGCLTSIDSCECVGDGDCSRYAVEGKCRSLTASKDASSLLQSNPFMAKVQSSCAQEKKRRRVCFLDVVDIHEIPHVRDMSQEELVDIWWTSNDYLLIRKMLRITVQCMAKGDKFSSEDGDFCASGLDFHTRAGSLRHHRHRQKAVRAIIDAQEFQRAENFTDAEYIAELYAECCRSSRDDALGRAMTDAGGVFGAE